MRSGGGPCRGVSVSSQGHPAICCGARRARVPTLSCDALERRCSTERRTRGGALARRAQRGTSVSPHCSLPPAHRSRCVGCEARCGGGGLPPWRAPCWPSLPRRRALGHCGGRLWEACPTADVCDILAGMKDLTPGKRTFIGVYSARMHGLSEAMGAFTLRRVSAWGDGGPHVEPCSSSRGAAWGIGDARRRGGRGGDGSTLGSAL